MTSRRFHTLAVLSTALGLILFFSEFSRFSYVRELVKAVNTLTSPLLRFKEHVVSELREEMGAYLHHVDVERENIKLRRRVNSLLLTERELEACLTELNKLTQRIGIEERFRRLNYTVSRIVYYDPSGLDLFVIIRGGKNRGFREGDLVVTESAVVGVVEAVFGSTSRVITPFNEKFSSSAIVKGRKKRYIYRGGFPEGDLLHVHVEDRVSKGDEILFTDVKRRIPSFTIGKVVSVERGKDPFFRKVKVKPAVDPREEEYVFVIRR